MARCPQCGYDQVRPGARFCTVCGAPIPAGSPGQGPNPSTGAQPPVQLPLTPPQPPPAPSRYQQQRVTPLGQGPVGPVFQPKQWNKPPQVEGYVLHVDGPYQENRRDLAGRAAAGCILAVLLTPVIAFLPFISGTKVDVRFLRILDMHTGQEVSVKMRGEPSGPIHQGDTVAVWARNERGTWDMIAAYNYNTNSEIRLRR